MKKLLLHTIGLIMLLRLLFNYPIFLNQREQLILKVIYSPIRAIRKQGFSLSIWLIDCCDFEAFEILKNVFLHVISTF